MRVLVTGASGFVGRHLCQYLTLVGDDVIALPGPDGPGALDVTDGSAVAQRISSVKPDGIVHLAGVSSVAWSHANPGRTFIVNGLGTVNVLQAVREGAPNARVLLIGSGEMYGRVTKGHRARESDILRPLSPYAASKCAAEIIAQQFAASYDLDIVCARPFNHIGSGQGAQFVGPSFARQIIEAKRNGLDSTIRVGDLSAVRDFLHVDDVVRGYRLLLEKGRRATAYNLCSGEPLSIRQLLEGLLELADVELKISVDPARLRVIEIPWLVGDPILIKTLGWQPVQSPRVALKELLDEALAQCH